MTPVFEAFTRMRPSYLSIWRLSEPAQKERLPSYYFFLFIFISLSRCGDIPSIHVVKHNVGTGYCVSMLNNLYLHTLLADAVFIFKLKASATCLTAITLMPTAPLPMFFSPSLCWKIRYFTSTLAIRIHQIKTSSLSDEHYIEYTLHIFLVVKMKIYPFTTLAPINITLRGCNEYHSKNK